MASFGFHPYLELKVIEVKVEGHAKKIRQFNTIVYESNVKEAVSSSSSLLGKEKERDKHDKSDEG